jgi:hypothetical protein
VGGDGGDGGCGGGDGGDVGGLRASYKKTGGLGGMAHPTQCLGSGLDSNV